MRSEFLPTIPAGIPSCNTCEYSRPTFFIQTMRGMRDEEEEQRRDVLRRLIKERADGVVAKFCNVYPELNPVYIAALVRAGSKKAFGPKTARSLEKKIGLPRYGLDAKTGADSMAQIEQAINSASWLEDIEKRHFIGLLKGMRGKRQ